MALKYEEFQNKGLQDALLKLKNMRSLPKEKVEVVAGWKKSTKYPNGFPVYQVAERNEYGAFVKVFGRGVGYITPRPFCGPAYEDNKSKWEKVIDEGLSHVIKGSSGASFEKVFKRLGALMVSDIKNAIDAVTEPPLAPLTIKLRLKAGVLSGAFDNDTMRQFLAGSEDSIAGTGYDTKPLQGLTGLLMSSVSYGVYFNGKAV